MICAILFFKIISTNLNSFLSIFINKAQPAHGRWGFPFAILQESN